MRKALPVLLTLSILVHSTQAQTIVSKFLWNSGSVTTADIGANATLGSGSTAILGSPGVGGTTGVIANGNNINLVIPGAEFELPGLDISEDFLRKENGASFFTLGGMDFGINTGAIYAKFLLNKAGTDTAVSLANFMTVPTDANFHTYRFIYDNVGGTFYAFLDGSLQYSKTFTAGYALSWTGATTAVIGSGMDGSGFASPILDNFIAQQPMVTLAIQLQSFNATANNNTNLLTWTTSATSTAQSFDIERSANGSDFATISTVPAQTNNSYQYTDNAPQPINFYRLKMIDADGSATWSPVRKLSSTTTGHISVSCYPNPVVNLANVHITDAEPGTQQLTLTTLDGRILQSGEYAITAADQQLTLDLSTAPKGILLLCVHSASTTPQTFKIWKQ